MTRLWLKPALAMLLASLTAACNTGFRGLDTQHQPVVRRTDYVMDIPVSGGLSDADDQQLAGWLSSLAPAYGDRISLDMTQAHLDAETLARLTELVAPYGLTLATPAPVTTGEIAPGSIRVILSRMTADVPDCPDWRTPAQPNWHGANMSNYGCATNGNLAAMVADPADLLAGRKGRPADVTMPTAKAVKAYRDAAPSGTQGLKQEGSSKP